MEFDEKTKMNHEGDIEDDHICKLDSFNNINTTYIASLPATKAYNELVNILCKKPAFWH